MYQSLEIDDRSNETPNVQQNGSMKRNTKMILLSLCALFVLGAFAHFKKEAFGRTPTSTIALESLAQKENPKDMSTRPHEDNLQYYSAVEGHEERLSISKSITAREDQTTVQCGQIPTGTVPANQQTRFRFTTPPTGTVTFDTCNANSQLQDTWLYMYTGANPTAANLYWNQDDSGNCQGTGYQVVQAFTVVAQGTTPNPNTNPPQLAGSTLYTIGVGAYADEFGAFTMRITCVGGNVGTTTAGPQTRTTTTTTTTTTSPPGTTTTTTSSPQTTTTTTTTANPQPTTTSSCPAIRVRRAWSQSSAADRQLYLDGYRQLRANGKLTIIRNQHTVAPFAHQSAQFLPWHRYFIWELEEQIRQLPDTRFRCFTLPFWDWTHARDANWNVNQIPMWGQGLGEFQNCINGYRDSNGACLTRFFSSNNPYRPSGITLTDMVEQNWSFNQFRPRLEGVHDTAHVSLGGHMSRIPDATDDPVFFMLHGFVDMIWALRQDCHNNRLIETTYPTPNTAMNFNVLRQQASWSLASRRSITAANTFNSRNSFLRVNYDARFMLQRAASQGVTMGACAWDHIIRPDTHMSRQQTHSYRADVQRGNQFCRTLPNMCSYRQPLQTCGEGTQKLDLTLGQVLRNVRGNPCLIQLRRKVYPFAKQMGDLRGLCNGFSDNVCSH